MDIKQIVLDLCALSDEQEWFESKENWFQREALGEYVSALSNAAAFHYKKYAYFIWGVNDTINAVLHNKWVEGNEPMISVFSDRIEILSRGTLAPAQTIEHGGGDRFTCLDCGSENFVPTGESEIKYEYAIVQI